MVDPLRLDMAMDPIQQTELFPWDTTPSFHATKFGGALILEFDGVQYHAEIVFNPVRANDILDEDMLAVFDDFQSSVNHILSDQALLENVIELLKAGSEADHAEAGTPGSENYEDTR